MPIRTPIDPARVPVAIFASVMGTAGLGLAWRIATATLGAPAAIAQTLLVCAALLFVVLTALYGIKIARSRALVVAEYQDAASSSYFGTIVIAIALLAYAAVPVSRALAVGLWAVGALGGALLLVALTGNWVAGNVKTAQITPIWFIPAVANAATVAAGVALGFREIAFASFAFAIVCWLTLLPLVLYRLIFAEPLPQKPVPSLAVLISSPAVLALAWLALTGGTADWVFRILVFKSVFSRQSSCGSHDWRSGCRSRLRGGATHFQRARSPRRSCGTIKRCQARGRACSRSPDSQSRPSPSWSWRRTRCARSR